jgi:hypothetical protein
MAATVTITRKISFGKRRYMIDVDATDIEATTDIELIDSTGAKPKLLGMDVVAFNVTKTAGTAANFTARLGKRTAFAAAGEYELAALATASTNSKNAERFAVDAPLGLWLRPGPASGNDNDFTIQIILEG